MGEARKVWTRTYFLDRLSKVEQLLREIEAVGRNGGSMPAALRRQLLSTSDRVGNLREKLREWAVTGTEKAAKDARERRRSK